MKIKYKPLVVILSMCLFMATSGYAQDCVQNLETAQQRFDEGRIQDIEGLLKTCVLQNVYTKGEKSQALRLLTLAYIYLEEPVEADYNMLRLLKTNHEFEINPAIDPTQFINLYKKYRTKPLFKVGARYIANLTSPYVTELNSSLDASGPGADKGTYVVSFAPVGLGINFEYALSDKFYLYPEIQYIAKIIHKDITQKMLTSDDTYFSIENEEDQNWLSIPISVKYVFDISPKFNMYVNAGGSFDYLIDAEKPGDEAFLDTNGASTVGFTIENKQQDHNKINFAVLAGGGATYKIGEGFISFEARYSYGLTKVTVPANALTPTDSRQIGNMMIQDDGYKLNSVFLSLGYTHNIYVPKKIN